ncbi:MAG: GNAT family N-acetyltransferase [Candidatus Uhrbacteria bacterium]
MLFRSMRLSDTPRVIDLLRQIGNQDFVPPSRLWFLTRWLLPTFHIFVLEDETGLVVAMVFLNRLPNPKYGWRGYIDYVVVEKSCRRRGFGRQIMTGVLTEAEKLGCREVLLTTSHPEAQALYESLGFKTKPSSVLVRRTS